MTISNTKTRETAAPGSTKEEFLNTLFRNVELKEELIAVLVKIHEATGNQYDAATILKTLTEITKEKEVRDSTHEAFIQGLIDRGLL
jgi:hypothetical protein